MSKQYGLIKPEKNKAFQIGALTARPAIFNDDSDSEPEVSKPTGITKNLKKQDKINQSKAVEEDPTVYQYDEIYDDMDKKRKDTLLAKKDTDRKPKYITKLLQAAEKRKRENERRIERQVQKEREAEGEEFKDKESFVTSAYRQKLEEMKELEEQERREEYLESIGDVRKQGNLDGFYRHLYDQKLNYEDKIKQEEEAEASTSNASPQNKRKSSTSDSEEESKKETISKVKKRKYRSRKDTKSDSEESAEEEKKEHLPSNLDADSDFSIDSSDSEDEVKKTVEDKENVIKQEVEEKTEDEKKVPEVEIKVEEKEEEKVVIKLPKKKSIDIWKKRTVGAVFDEALKRYFERKALREAGN